MSCCCSATRRTSIASSGTLASSGRCFSSADRYLSRVGLENVTALQLPRAVHVLLEGHPLAVEFDRERRAELALALDLAVEPVGVALASEVARELATAEAVADLATGRWGASGRSFDDPQRGDEQVADNVRPCRTVGLRPLVEPFDQVVGQTNVDHPADLRTTGSASLRFFADGDRVLVLTAQAGDLASAAPLEVDGEAAPGAECGAAVGQFVVVLVDDEAGRGVGVAVDFEASGVICVIHGGSLLVGSLRYRNYSE
jgi:hypothetical protein